ncbi:hypothetical protein GCM10010358_36090 [Streptomyces minutiscleroticus]|uniref:Uncharacterized protein n=1 Tax=Streptomyces minutiscleroticus TaxID=68238 RepID=A0A918NLE1_9ACTN|nr:hypothetical protein GCM10010358_36090 [Streptomyces minutiscleroticus]
MRRRGDGWRESAGRARRAGSDDPCGPRRGGGCETVRMPVLDPNPQNGQKKMLLVFGAMLAITVVIGVIASIAAP